MKPNKTRTTFLAIALAVIGCGTGGGGTIGPNEDAGLRNRDDSGTSGQTTNPGARIEAAKYTDTCSVNEDCVLAYFGPLCKECGCSNDAIAKAGQDAYAAERQSLRATCPPFQIDCSCPKMEAECSNGKCTAVPSGAVDAGSDH